LFRGLIGQFLGLFAFFFTGVHTATKFPDRRAKFAAKSPDATSAMTKTTTSSPGPTPSRFMAARLP
jgi:hypothetical protein